MYASEVRPTWIGKAIGQPRVWHVTIEHENGFEPGVLHEIGGAVWRKEVPFRLSIAEAVERAHILANRAVELERVTAQTWQDPR